MKGEHSDVDAVFETGDVYEFKMEHLTESSDANVVRLSAIALSLDRQIQTLMEQNDISWLDIRFDVLG